MMDKLRMHTADLAAAKFAKLAELFPNAMTETTDENGTVIRTVDPDILRQETNTHVLSGKEERYQFTWPDIRKSILLSNAPIAAALRSVRNDETTPTGRDSAGKPARRVSRGKMIFLFEDIEWAALDKHWINI